MTRVSERVTDLLGVAQGSLFGDADALSWNLSDLKSILRLIDLPGVTRPMLYFGMWRAMFAFHTVSRHSRSGILGGLTH